MGATFIYPTVKRVTSKFRTSSRPNHHGVDFAEPGYQEVKAAADGHVVKSYLSTSYGHCIIVEHVFGKDVWQTLYAHLKERKVFLGDKVKQGQVIGIMGNTGDSTGQHLHFELHKGRWNINKTDAVDPLKYLGKDLYPKPKKTISQMADEVIAGKHGNGHENRRKSLGISKAEYEKVRAEVNRRLSPQKSISQMATEIIQGKHGNGHENRRKSLGIDKATYEKVRAEVNRRL